MKIQNPYPPAEERHAVQTWVGQSDWELIQRSTHVNRGLLANFLAQVTYSFARELHSISPDGSPISDDQFTNLVKKYVPTY